MARVGVAVVKILRLLLLAVGALSIGIVAGGQMGLFASKPPADLGVHDGRLKAAPPTPNCVNSQSAGGYSQIAPLTYTGDGGKALEVLRTQVAGMTGAKIVDVRPGYVRAEFSTRWMGFVDDVEFYLDESSRVIHVRSASRLGRKDFGVNRERVEAIRARFGTP